MGLFASTPSHFLFQSHILIPVQIFDPWPWPRLIKVMGKKGQDFLPEAQRDYDYSLVESLSFVLCHLYPWSNELKAVHLDPHEQLCLWPQFLHDLDGSWSKSWVENLGFGLRHLNPCSNYHTKGPWTFTLCLTTYSKVTRYMYLLAKWLCSWGDYNPV